MKREDIIAFEEGIASDFNAGKIRYPVHLESGNEDQLIRIFENVKQQDYIFGSWRLHSKALLKGVPPEELKSAIYRGESMALRFPEYRVYGSAIAGGMIPIALGTALSIKLRDEPDHVWCFLGDMMAESGIFHECSKYAANHGLPITWIVEDNSVSVCTPTAEVWGESNKPDVRRYQYKSKYPHAGAGSRIQF